MICNEVVTTWGGTQHYVCTAIRYTEHSHADRDAYYMEPLPEDATLALDDLDCLWLIETA